MRFMIRPMLFVLLMILVGCSSGPKVQDDSKSVSTQVVPQEKSRVETFIPQGIDAENEGPVVTLLTAGEKPHQSLRYQFNDGYSDTMILDMAMSMKTMMSGMTMADLIFPTTRMWVEIKVVDVAQDGSCRYSADYFNIEVMESEGVDPMVAEAYTAEMVKLIGMTGAGVMTPRGFQPEMSFELPPGAGPEVKSSMEQMEQSMQNVAAPFPEEEVGIGGRWSVFVPFAANGISGSQTATYELLELTDNGAHMNVELVQDFPEQNIESPDLPAGTVVRLTGCDSSAEGFISVIYDSLVPQSGILMDMMMYTNIEAEGMSQSMEMNMKMDMSVFGQELIQ